MSGMPSISALHVLMLCSDTICPIDGTRLRAEVERALAMKTICTTIAGIALATLLASAAMAQSAAVTTYGGSTSGNGSSFVGRQMTPLATFGDLSVGIWSRVPPPYDATASYNGAANPLP
jgi:hypothetical protein